MTYIALSDPRVASKPTTNCSEALVSIVHVNDKILIDTSQENIDILGYSPEFLVRKTVADKLIRAGKNLPEEVKTNRGTLFSCLREQGFINYPFEWWHWSYGDIYWAAMSNEPHAIYGAVESGAS